jgi:flavin-dependent dehydrogenase
VTGRVRDAVVVGGGPAGLAFAIAAAVLGLDVTVLERRAGALDKACGEGLLPGGVRALEALGARAHVPAADAAPIREIRWIEPGSDLARLRLPPPGGLGIRRTALSAALLRRAQEVGVEVLPDAEVVAHRREPGGIRAIGRGGDVAARVLVAADGLASPTRRREGLEAPAPPRRPRYGVRRHIAVPPWADAVEIHFAEDAEAYVTPAGANRVGIAVLFEQGEPGRFEVLMQRFPALAGLVAAAEPDSTVRGAGPFNRRATARVADRLVLLGDAAGYVDAVTGEGVTLAFRCARELAGMLPRALARGAGCDALRPYEAIWRRHFRPYAAWTRSMLWLSRSPRVRRRVLALAAARPAPFEKVVAAAVG